MEIKGKTILITGGLGSLGAGIAEALKGCGANKIGRASCRERVCMFV